MVYITVMQSPIYHQMTLEEFLFQNFQAQTILNTNVSNTRTYAYETVSEHFTSRIDTDALIRKLVRFNDQTRRFAHKNAVLCMKHSTSPKSLVVCVVLMPLNRS